MASGQRDLKEIRKRARNVTTIEEVLAIPEDYADLGIGQAEEALELLKEVGSIEFDNSKLTINSRVSQRGRADIVYSSTDRDRAILEQSSIDIQVGLKGEELIATLVHEARHLGPMPVR